MLQYRSQCHPSHGMQTEDAQAIGRLAGRFRSKDDLFSRIARRSSLYTGSSGAFKSIHLRSLIKHTASLDHSARYAGFSQSGASSHDTQSLVSGIQGAALAVVTYPAFEHLVMALIVANCIMLALFNPTAPPHSRMQSQMETAELAFNIVFTVEMLLRIVSLGSVYSYLSNPWNLFDAVMVLAGCVHTFDAGSVPCVCCTACANMKLDSKQRCLTAYCSVCLQVFPVYTNRICKHWRYQGFESCSCASAPTYHHTILLPACHRGLLS